MKSTMNKTTKKTSPSIDQWLNEGLLEVGDNIMHVLIGGDIRPHVIDGLQSLVEKIKTECVTEIEQKN